MSSISFVSAAAYKDHVELVGEELITRMFYGFETAKLVTTHEGVKGKKVLTELVIGSDLVKKYRSQFDPVAGAIDFKPRVLEVFPAKVDLSIVPQDFESSYLGQFRKKGQDPRDFPFEAYVMDKIVERVHQEIEHAVHSAAIPGVPTATDPIRLLFDGYLEIIKDAIAATDLTVATTGAITADNIVSSVEIVWDSLDVPTKAGATMAFVSVQNYTRYMRKYRSEFGKYTEPGKMQTKLDFADCTLVAQPGMGSSNRIIIMPADNFHLGYDGITDHSMFNFDTNTRELRFWMDFKIGVQIGICKDGIVAVNEQV